MDIKKDMTGSALIESMFKAGLHFGQSRSRRHPSVAPYIFGVKNKVEIIDLEKTAPLFEKALSFISSIASSRGGILFVTSKKESEQAVKRAALLIEMPYVTGRWIGGTFTNFVEIKKRIERFEDLSSKKEKGLLAQYTKKERLLIDREIANLERFFGGIVSMKTLPKAIIVVDPRKEHIAVTEAHKQGIPVIALSGTDCNISDIEYPVVGNDASLSSVSFFLDRIMNAWKEGLMKAPALKTEVSVSPSLVS